MHALTAWAAPTRSGLSTGEEEMFRDGLIRRHMLCWEGAQILFVVTVGRHVVKRLIIIIVLSP